MQDIGGRVIVIGAGPAGLAFAAAYEGDVTVVEAESKVGGLCRSIHNDGAVFDLGGHSFHTPHREVLDFVENSMGQSLYSQMRDARIHFDGQLIPYPFQQNFHQIHDELVVDECSAGLPKTEASIPTTPPDNLKQFFEDRFGEGICKHFMLPYNAKIWGCDLSTIECKWTSERVAAPSGQTEKFSETDGVRKPLQSDTVVRYPREGGFEEIFKAIASNIDDIRLNCQVVAIDPENRQLETSNGQILEWDRIVSTMPVDKLVRMVRGFPEDIRSLAERLEYLSLHLSMLTTNKPLSDVPQRIYVHGDEVFAHKIAFNNTSSPALREQMSHAIMGEASYSAHKSLDHQAVDESLVAFLSKLGLVDGPQDFQDVRHIKIEYGYPIQTTGTRDTVDALVESLESLHISSIGRFGQWKYINSDACIKMGLGLAEQLSNARLSSAGG